MSRAWRASRIRRVSRVRRASRTRRTSRTMRVSRAKRVKRIRIQCLERILSSRKRKKRVEMIIKPCVWRRAMRRFVTFLVRLKQVQAKTQKMTQLSSCNFICVAKLLSYF
jgi:hypothetical protein